MVSTIKFAKIICKAVRKGNKKTEDWVLPFKRCNVVRRRRRRRFRRRRRLLRLVRARGSED